MSEKRFTLMLPNAIINDTIVRKSYYLSEKDDVEKLVGVLNKQQDTISALKEENEQLRQQLKQKQEEERLYANEILELRKTNEEFMQFKELGGDY